MKKLIFDDNEYKLIEDYKNGFDNEEFKNKYTDYFYNYDYILGDWAYGKLRLKGFYDKKNPNCSKVNDFANYKDYLKDYCAYECRYFVLQRIK